MKRLIYAHPFILAAISPVILFVSMSNVGIYISPAAVMIPILWGLAIALVLFLLAYWLTRQSASAALVASIVVLGLIHLWYIFLAVIIITLFSLLIFKLVLKRIRLEDINLGLAIISLFMFVFYMIRFGIFIKANPSMDHSAQATVPVMDGQKVTRDPGQSPDIYYIILDGYGRQDMLQAVHGYDNSAFTEGLTQRGFVVESQSQANYPRTLLSLSSSLNMQYLDSLSLAMGGSNLWWPAGDAIQHSQVRAFLEQQGYKTVFIASGWDYTDIRDGDAYLKPYPTMLSNFQMAFIGWTNLRFFGNSWSGISFPSNHESRQVILHDFTALASAPAIQGPKFVFAHIMAPHPPYLFGSDGGPALHDIVHPDVGTADYAEKISQYRQGYLDQLLYVNKKVLDMIDSIQSSSKTLPIIIIQGDHGPDVFMDFKKASDACLYERYSILNAYFLPGQDPASIPPDMEPVNTFRLVFNRYFGTDLPLLPNQQFYSPDLAIYQFQNITGQTQAACSLPVQAEP
jgi:hypothetical protein